MNPKISRLRAEREKNNGKIAALQTRNREIDSQIMELENTDIIGLARATGMSMEELAQFLTQLKRGGAPFITPNTKEDTDYVHEEE
ncbi:DUF4315 family protein [Flavonifractor plautii]|jgi:cell division protein FtsB|uniref:DUF4315 family protein n=1 Tax=Flavonifractor plautii TaxID=292800 RepID=A0AAW6C534_FLAPL|nr:DUF4315 family protein [Flavonifractor plautii]HJH84608.1 DUF4315 family protein [Clostridiales bacterium]MDB7868930.1 DUF4315 family protein [Flavonifractor plautii]MDB7873042.1 DUF4315 family protein [Flavonifractor plautii]MDB7884219.1 DUF4315 family protein [Flavonifractor plautii]MDB7889510.1 DUF4315 family protein [Flavonifractor plautii]